MTKQGEGSAIKAVLQSSEGKYFVSNPKSNSGETDVLAIQSANANKLTVKGLAPGTYTLEETKTYEGYSMLDKPVTIVISAGSQVADPVTATVDGATATVENGLVKVSVVNTRITTGFTLPATGGAGTIAAIAIGFGLICAAVVLLAAYRRKERKDV